MPTTVMKSSTSAITKSGAESRPRKKEPALWREAVLPICSMRSEKSRASNQPRISVTSQPRNTTVSSVASVGTPQPGDRMPTATLWPLTCASGGWSSTPPIAMASPSTFAPVRRRTEPNTATTSPSTVPSTSTEPNTATTSPGMVCPAGTWASANNRTRPASPVFTMMEVPLPEPSPRRPRSRLPRSPGSPRSIRADPP